MAHAARLAHGLERVLLVPARKPPHKAEAAASPEDRLAMARLAAEGEEGLEASPVEIERPGPSYTVDTLEALQPRYPGADLFFILGEDSIPDFSGWKDARRILDLARIVAVNRPGWSAVFHPDSLPGVPPEVLRRLERDRVTMPGVPFESRRIREAVRAGRPFEDAVPAAVAEYIRSRRLYR